MKTSQRIMHCHCHEVWNLIYSIAKNNTLCHFHEELWKLLSIHNEGKECTIQGSETNVSNVMAWGQEYNCISDQMNLVQSATQLKIMES